MKGMKYSRRHDTQPGKANPEGVKLTHGRTRKNESWDQGLTKGQAPEWGPYGQGLGSGGLISKGLTLNQWDLPVQE